MTVIRGFITLSLCLVALQAAAAQGPPPTSAECTAAVDSLAGGSRNSGRWGYLAHCGASGAAALATRMAGLAGESDTVYLAGLLPTLIAVKDPALFNASRALANNPSGTVASRVTAIAALVSHYNPAYDIISRVGWTSTIAAARGRRCQFGSSGAGDYNYTASLPTNYAAQLAATLDSIELRPVENAVVRDLARCARELIDEVPVNPPTSALTLSYVCGTTFSVRNTSSRPAELTYRVSSDTGEYDMYVQPTSSATFFTLRLGTVDLYLNGLKILTAKNPGKACP